LLRDITKITLEKTAQKILCLSASYDHTFVFVRIDKPSEVETIVHMDSKGKILWEHSYNTFIDFFGQMNDYEVIVCNVPESKIDILNLKTQKVRQVNHQYTHEDCAQMGI
jgi:hypothetical protein